MTPTEPKGKVLIIDDDVLVAAMLKAHATAAGYEAEATGDPEVFLARERTWRPDFVIIDLVMAGVDGLEILKRLAQVRSESAVVITSGMGNQVLDSARRFAAASGLSYGGVLDKPFLAADVADVLEEGAQAPDESDTAQDVFAELSDDDFAAAIRDAAAVGEICVALQPKVSCVTDAVVGFEALARWRHPTHGLIAPIDFIPRAERIGAMPAITDTVSRQAMEWFAATALRSPGRLSLNISATELVDGSLDGRLLEACRATGVRPEQVILEVTETSAISDRIHSLELLTRLRLDGFALSIDDFGTGYASMAQLSTMPFSEVKIDRDFVRHLGEALPTEVMVRSMLQLSHALGLECTAEGVETERALNLLTEMGCDYAQGYLIAKPLFPEELQAWLESRAA